MDTFVQGLTTAQKLLDDGILETFITNRYASYQTGIGGQITAGKVDFKSLEKYALQLKEIKNSSGSQEYLETVLNEYLLSD